MPTDPRDLEPEEVREALDELREDLEIQDKPNAIRLVEVQLALATMAARMLEAGEVGSGWRHNDSGQVGAMQSSRTYQRPVRVPPEGHSLVALYAYPEPGETE